MSGDYSFLDKGKGYMVNAARNPYRQKLVGRNLLEAQYFVHNGVANLLGLNGTSRDQLNLLAAKYPNPSLLVGVEIEVEKYRGVEDVGIQDAYWQDLFWVEHEDGSLRNNGREFVTRLGMTADMLPEAVTHLVKVIHTRANGKAEVNARTGLHVHINVSDLTVYELCNLLLIYALVEPLIFEVSGSREQSIFCVPWEFNRFTLGHVIQNLGRNCVENGYAGDRAFRWRNYSKYCGLNISTVETYGTVEFRMHHGTLDPKVIIRWVNTLQRLYNYAKSTDLLTNIDKFRSNRQDYTYWPMITSIFEDYMDQLEPKRAEHITRCKHSTLSFFKHFIDRSKMPDTLTTVKPEAKLEFRWEEPVFNFDIPQAPPRRPARPVAPNRDQLLERVLGQDPPPVANNAHNDAIEALRLAERRRRDEAIQEMLRGAQVRHVPGPAHHVDLENGFFEIRNEENP